MARNLITFFYRPSCTHALKISTGVDGELSRGLRVRRPGSEDPHQRQRKFFSSLSLPIYTRHHLLVQDIERPDANGRKWKETTFKYFYLVGSWCSCLIGKGTKSKPIFPRPKPKQRDKAPPICWEPRVAILNENTWRASLYHLLAIQNTKE